MSVQSAEEAAPGLAAPERPENPFSHAARQFDPAFRVRWDDFWRSILAGAEAATFLKPSDRFELDAPLTGLSARQVCTLRTGTYEGAVDPAPLGVWIEGERLDGKRVVDLGCGLGFLTVRLAGGTDFCLGVDVSPFAVHVTRGLTYATGNVEVLGVHETSALEALAGSFDTVVSRSFMAHLPLEDAAALLGLGRALLKPDGRMSVAFFMQNPDAVGVRAHGARSGRDPDTVTAGHHYEEQDIRDVAAAAGLRVAWLQPQPETSQRFVVLAPL